MTFQIGFRYKGFKYAWYDNKLYRLPIKKKGRHLSLTEVKECKVGNSTGYYLARRKFSKKQIEMMNKAIDWEIKILECDHCG